jgi:hypothetical protein
MMKEGTALRDHDKTPTQEDIFSFSVAADIQSSTGLGVKKRGKSRSF